MEKSAQLSHRHADFRFVDGRVQVLDGLSAVTIEVVFGGLQLVLGAAHGLKSLIDMRMSIGTRNGNRRRCRSSGWGCGSGRSLRSGGCRGESKREH